MQSFCEPLMLSATRFSAFSDYLLSDGILPDVVHQVVLHVTLWHD